MSRLFAGTPFDIPPTCDVCGQLEQECSCPPEQHAPQWLPANRQRAQVRLDRRKHKRVMTVVWGLSANETDLPALLSELKTACGAGGSLQDHSIEIQGDHLSRVTDKLKQIGYRVG